MRLTVSKRALVLGAVVALGIVLAADTATAQYRYARPSAGWRWAPQYRYPASLSPSLPQGNTGGRLSTPQPIIIPGGSGVRLHPLFTDRFGGLAALRGFGHSATPQPIIIP